MGTSTTSYNLFNGVQTPATKYDLNLYNSGVTGSSGYGIGTKSIFNNNLNTIGSSGYGLTGNAILKPTGVNGATGYSISGGNYANSLNNYGSALGSGTTDWTNSSMYSNGLTTDQINQLIQNQTNAVNNQAYNQTFSNWLGVGQLALNGLAGIGSYLNGKSYLKLAKQQLQQQNDQFNETYNNKLKEYNTSLADRLRARAAFETGDSTAYNDEITANSMQRGYTGNADSSYLNYQRSTNADNPYNKKETNPDQ